MEHPSITQANRTGYPTRNPITHNRITMTSMCGCERRLGKHHYGNQYLCTPCAIEGGFISELADIS